MWNQDYGSPTENNRLPMKCALILLETSALYKLFTYLLTYLLRVVSEAAEANWKWVSKSSAVAENLHYSKAWLLSLTKYCKWPLFVDTCSYACEKPGVIKLQMVDIQSALSVTAVADAHSFRFIKDSVDLVAVVNAHPCSTAKRFRITKPPAEHCCIARWTW